MEQLLRKQVVEVIADMLMHTPFTVEYKVVKRPKGVKIIYEVTQEELDEVMLEQAQKISYN